MYTYLKCIFKKYNGYCKEKAGKGIESEGGAILYGVVKESFNEKGTTRDLD